MSGPSAEGPVVGCACRLCRNLRDDPVTRAAAALKPYLPTTYRDDEIRAVAEVALSAAGVPTGEDE